MGYLGVEFFSWKRRFPQRYQLTVRKERDRSNSGVIHGFHTLGIDVYGVPHIENCGVGSEDETRECEIGWIPLYTFHSEFELGGEPVPIHDTYPCGIHRLRKIHDNVRDTTFNDGSVVSHIHLDLIDRSQVRSRNAQRVIVESQKLVIGTF